MLAAALNIGQASLGDPGGGHVQVPVWWVKLRRAGLLTAPIQADGLIRIRREAYRKEETRRGKGQSVRILLQLLCQLPLQLQATRNPRDCFHSSIHLFEKLEITLGG